MWAFMRFLATEAERRLSKDPADSFGVLACEWNAERNRA